MSHPFVPSLSNATIVPGPDHVVSDATFGDLEWSVVRLARNDRLWSIRPLGRVRRLVNWLLNIGSLELANDRLEALRKAAVLSWHFGFSIPGQDVTDFLSAGFTAEQYEQMVLSIADARTASSRTFS
jgi:hypothetical protein